MFSNHHFRKFILLIFLGLLFGAPTLSGQISEAEARDMLAQRGIPEDTLRARLTAKGYNPDNIAPDQLAEFQEVVLETVKEIETGQGKKSNPPPPIKEQLQALPSPAVVPQKVIQPPELPVGDTLPQRIYGQEIFQNNTISVYQKSEDLVAQDAYVLGTGDKIGVIGFGRSQFEQILEINQDGFVQPGDRLPKILLKGVRLGDAKELLYQRYSQSYVIARGEFQVTLNKPRNMTVNVFGEARTTGSYTLPGINTAFNVISAAGGPTEIGSVRRIKIIRGSQSIPLDVYEFMNDPGIAKNYFLQNNDYIHIPVAQKVVTIKGAVTKPMTYELLDHENLTQLVKYAGGAKANAYLSFVQVTRFMNDKAIITNVNLKELADSGGDYILFNGDIIEIKTITGNAQNTVSISGAVAYPGKYECREGMKVADLLKQSILLPDARLDFAFLLHYQNDGTYKFERINLSEVLSNEMSSANVVLSNQDMLQVMTLKTYVDPGFFSVTGAVKNPDTFAFSPDDRLMLEDAILLAGGTIAQASDFGYILRKNPKEPKTVEYVHIDIKKALEDPYSGANVKILAGDQIILYDKGGRRDEITVSVYGAVRNPGTYVYGPGMRLADLISLSGGFKFEADHDRIDVARSEFQSGQNVKISQQTAQLPKGFEQQYDEDDSMLLMPFDHVYVRAIPEYEMQRTVTIEGEVKYPGDYPILEDNERIYDLIQRAGGLTGQAFPEGAKLFREGDGTGLVVIDLYDIMKDNKRPSNIILAEGDIIEIPKSRDLVTIGGNVNLDQAYSLGYLNGERSISVAYRGRKNAKFYVDRFAAGVSETGTMSKLIVQYADGRVQNTRKVFLFNKHPEVRKGSVITVGAKKVKTPVEKSEKKTDWGIILRDTMYQATAILTLLILVDELSN